MDFSFGATTYLKFQDAFIDGMHELPMVWVGSGTVTTMAMAIRIETAIVSGMFTARMDIANQH